MRASPVETAVLALVIEQPSHRYELWKRYDERFGALLPVLTSRIYKAVKQLQDAELVEPLPLEDGPEVTRLRGPQFRATPPGAQAHRAWLIEGFQDDPLRKELQLRLLSSGVSSTPVILDVVDRYEAACIEEMEQIGTPRICEGTAHNIGPALQDQLVAEERRLMLDARVRWVAYARKAIRAAGEQIDHARGSS